MLRGLIEAHAARHGFLSAKIVAAAQLYLNAYCRLDDYDFHTNGEDRLLRNLAAFKPRVVFDVGANVGDWTQAALEQLPEARIHAFELSPVTAVSLERRFGSSDRIKVNDTGLSNRNGEVEISHVDADCTLSTLHENTANLKGRRLVARVTTGQEYLALEGLDEVDLLKIDTEGHDLGVIEGFGEAINCCHLIQFEYNECSWSRGVFIDKFQRLLPGFRIGRLTSGGVLWDRSRISNDRAMAGNMIAVPERRADVIAALARFR